MSKVLKIYNSSQAAGYLRDYMSGLDHEEMWAMFLNNDNRMIEQEMLTKGTLDSTMIDARTKLGAEFKVVLRPDESSKKFSVLPLRWIVERSFSWLENFRRIDMDYEFYSETGVAMVQLAFCRLMYNKIYD